jgi:hypothetical protein
VRFTGRLRRNAARVRPLASNAASAARPSASLQHRPAASSRSRARSVPPILLAFVFATVTSVAEPASIPSGSAGAVHRAVTYSHHGSVAQPAHDLSILSETRAVLLDVLEMMRHADCGHYERMLEASVGAVDGS